MWEFECRGANGASDVEYRFIEIGSHVFCPSTVFACGVYRWRYRGFDGEGRATAWSQTRQFTITDLAAAKEIEFVALLPTDDDATLTAGDLTTTGAVVVRRLEARKMVPLGSRDLRHGGLSVCV